MEKIAAVIVTYNRLELLKLVVNSLKNQTRKLDRIIIVNNSSTDGTDLWLSEQKDLFIVTQENLGGAGGFHTGLKVAYEQGYDWIWFMDDDVLPADNCLEILLNNFDKNTIRIPLRYFDNGDVFYNDIIEYNFKNPFKTLWFKLINESDLKNECIKVSGPTFEGPLLHRKILDKIGFPITKFFIFADDTEFFVRAKRNGFEIYVYRDAKLYKKQMSQYNISQFTWKHYYIIRNIIVLDVLYGNIWVRLLRPIGYLILWLSRCRNFDNIKTTIKAFIHGYFYKDK